MGTIIKKGWELLKTTAKHWQSDNAPRLGAALAYYAVLALPPILVILLFIVSLFYNPHTASAQVSQQLNSVMGPQSGPFLQKLMSNPQIHGKGLVATGIAIIVLIVSATGFFVELKNALNSAWGLEQRSDVGWRGAIVSRALSFLLLIAIGVLLIVSVLATTGLTAAQHALGGSFTGSAALWRLLEFIVSCGILTALFAMLYKFLPDARVPWRDVWAGALITAFLFTVGKFLLGFYLGHSSVASAYGVAGSIVLILVWVYYSAQIFLFGAEFTQVYASRKGRRIVPTKQAQWKAEGESAAEDREEAQTAGRLNATEGTAQKPAPAKAPEPAREEVRRPAQTPAPLMGYEQQILHELADRIHSWPSILHSKT